ncbi:zinc carboxypeptidase domain-containing protein [Phthorimaea operculella]|nr:zinc carboxypeptidase domain-containing protein [Phthorimaea operculella]
MDLASVFSYLINAASKYRSAGVFERGASGERESARSEEYNATRPARDVPQLTSMADLASLRKRFPCVPEISYAKDLSIWMMNKSAVDYLVSSENVARIHDALRKKKLRHDVLISDVQKKIDETKAHPSPWSEFEYALRKGHRLDFVSFPDIQKIDEFIEFLGAEYPSIAKVKTIGQSWEKRLIKMISISNGNPTNKIMIIVGGHHAREWAGITSVLYIANNIVKKFDEQPVYMKSIDCLRSVGTGHHAREWGITSVLYIANNIVKKFDEQPVYMKSIDWYIIPLLNPDGYQHTQTKDRLWRKNRRMNPDAYCPGTDLNRNYPFNWKIEGVTNHDPCADEYAGPWALSEPEVRALVGVFESMGHKKPSAYLDIHSYGQFIIYPWSSVKTPSPHHHILVATASKIAEEIYLTTQHSYTPGTTTGLLYAASGSSIDYFHSEGVRQVYAFEVRDTLHGHHGFLLPPDEIEDIYLTTQHSYTPGTLTELLYVASGSSTDYFHSVGVEQVYAFEVRDHGNHGFLLPPDEIEIVGKEMLVATRTVAEIIVADKVKHKLRWY